MDIESMNMEVKKVNLGYFNHTAAAAHPNKTALIDLSREGNHILTHSELDDRMDSVATLLSTLQLSTTSNTTQRELLTQPPRPSRERERAEIDRERDGDV